MTHIRSINKTRFLPLIFGLLLLSGCFDGGGSGGGNEPSDLPPDPGEAGMRTLLGIDSNNNGLRDDVERAVHERAQELTAQNAQTDPAITRQALTQLAKNMLNDITMYDRLASTNISLPATVILTDTQKSDIFQSGERAVRCLLSMDLNLEQEVLQLRSVILNTTARYTAYHEIDAALAGTLYEHNYPGGISETGCEE